MKKLLFISSLFLFANINAQKLDVRVAAGINSNQTFTTNLAVSLTYKNVVAETNMICAGYSGERQPVLLGGRIGYKVWYLTPLVGFYYARVSDDKLSLNYNTMLYGLRAEKEIVEGNGVFAEYDYARQNIFLIGVKIKL